MEMLAVPSDREEYTEPDGTYYAPSVRWVVVNHQDFTLDYDSLHRPYAKYSPIRAEED